MVAQEDVWDGVRWANAKNRGDPVDFFYAHFDPSIRRGTLNLLDPGLYKRLSDDGDLEGLIGADESLVERGRHLGTLRAAYADEDTVATYEANHKGVSRGDLSLINPGLYHRMRRRGTLHHVPRKSELK